MSSLVATCQLTPWKLLSLFMWTEVYRTSDLFCWQARWTELVIGLWLGAIGSANRDRDRISRCSSIACPVCTRIHRACALNLDMQLRKIRICRRDMPIPISRSNRAQPWISIHTTIFTMSDALNHPYHNFNSDLNFKVQVISSHMFILFALLLYRVQQYSIQQTFKIRKDSSSPLLSNCLKILYVIPYFAKLTSFGG